jgi:hypothetical protein
MSKKKNASNTVRAWIAKEKTPMLNLEEIQSQFENVLTVSQLKDGSIVIYPSGDGNRTNFDIFMGSTGAFEQKTLSLNKI